MPATATDESARQSRTTDAFVEAVTTSTPHSPARFAIVNLGSELIGAAVLDDKKATMLAALALVRRYLSERAVVDLPLADYYIACAKVADLSRMVEGS